MRKSLLLIVLLAALGFFAFKTIKDNVRKDIYQPVALPTSVPTPPLKLIKDIDNSKIRKSLFIPYWTITRQKLNSGHYNKYLYFGITPASSGIDKQEAGFVGLSKFLAIVPEGSDKELVVRMVNSDDNFTILKDTIKQKSIINDSIALANINGFSGVILDLELSAVPFDSLVKQVDNFTSLFHSEVKKNNLQFGLMLYGDSFYRLRPFDVKALSKNADEFLIMAYDFSKARGNPGPNFPLQGKEVYGYDMTKMSDDFLQFLPVDKTSVVFGVFGYDWIVDEKGNALSQANPLTDLQIQKQFLTNCQYKDCIVTRKNDSKETEITYTDTDGKMHVVWFEDMQSIAAKEKYLQQRGINNFSFWSYSYF